MWCFSYLNAIWISKIVFYNNGADWDHIQYQASPWWKEYVVGIFIDFKKAFDTVDHEIMLSKLDCYGIRGHANVFFR